MIINFNNEGIKYKLTGKRQLKKWIHYIASEEGREIGEINYNFSSDEIVREINSKFLNHHYNTDIITFNHNVGDVLFGDVFISIDTVKENASKYNVSFHREIQRVLIHGLLHLIGYDDVTEKLQRLMREKEDETLFLLDSKFNIK